MKRLWKYLRLLKRDFPTSKPVRVRTSPDLHSEDDKVFGTCRLMDGYFLISLDRNHVESVVIDTLFHEWVHALLWPRCKFRHTKRFWDQYGEIYRKYIDDNQPLT